MALKMEQERMHQFLCARADGIKSAQGGPARPHSEEWSIAVQHISTKLVRQ
jgi:hypothetical protein